MKMMDAGDSQKAGEKLLTRHPSGLVGILILDALRYKPHPTHSSVDESLRIVGQLQPQRAFFTHICHDLEHERAESLLPKNVRLAYDGLEIIAGDFLR